MRLQVKIVVTKLLSRGIWVFMDEYQTEVSLLFQYERMPNFCFICGIIGHKAYECSNRIKKEKGVNITTLSYGPWVKFIPSPSMTRRNTDRKREILSQFLF